jgi:biopolymer transport protein ExbD
MRIEPLPICRRRWGLTPLVDVVFLLLVFFMLVSSWQELRSLELKAPTTVGGSGIKGAVLVRVLPDGSLDLNGVSVDLTELTVQIRGYLSHTPEQQVLVRPAATVPLQDLVDVLDRLHAMGVANLNLIKE